MKPRTKSDEIRERLDEENPEALFADGFDDALIGVSAGCNRPSLAVYDIDMCILVLMTRDLISRGEAEDYFWYNVAGGWHGENTPLFVQMVFHG